MKNITIGTSDLTVGEIAYGCWRFAQNSPSEARTLIETALDAGITLIDTADIYGFGQPMVWTADRGFGEAEAVLGEVLKDAPSLRDKMTLVTKGGIMPPRPYDSSFDYLTGALEASLKRLKTDLADLYLIHRPSLTESFEEAGRALDSLVDAGKTRYVGVSNFTASQASALQAHMRAPLVVHQNEFSALEQSPITDSILDQCQERDMTLMAWSPLAGGKILSRDVHFKLMPVLDVMGRIAKQHDCDITHVALAFILRHPASTMAIIGTQKPARILHAAKASGIKLSARDWYDIVEAYRGRRMP